MKPLKLLFILPSLRAGGAERVISYLSSLLSKDGQFKVQLLVVGFEKDSVYDVSGVDVIYLNKARLLEATLSIFSIIRTKRPDVVIGSISHVNVMLGVFSYFFKKIRFVAREASVFSEMSKYTGAKSSNMFKMMKWFYPRLDMIVCQSQDMKNDFIQLFNLPDSRLKVINNPLTINDVYNVEEKFTEEVKFVTVGRLSMEKGHERVLRCLSEVKGTKFSYTIIGSGPLEKEVNDLVNDLGLNSKVNFIPYSNTIQQDLCNYDYFLQGSFVEGFPNGLLESCSVGTPVIAFEAPGGTKEILQNGINGYLVKDEPEFIQLLSEKDNLFRIRREDVRASVIDKFSSSKILEQYKEVLKSS